MSTCRGWRANQDGLRGRTGQHRCTMRVHRLQLHSLSGRQLNRHHRPQVLRTCWREGHSRSSDAIWKTSGANLGVHGINASRTWQSEDENAPEPTSCTAPRSSPSKGAYVHASRTCQQQPQYRAQNVYLPNGNHDRINTRKVKICTCKKKQRVPNLFL